ncbi:E3 ubiquitin-protein ligase MARCHF9-like [Melanotaenia boesemani]|uniref:E3 ubiquitin-protein ligase MARCHF9-like n=1 Tax=Melanotaenia boesemani TaxID=1250792 RepID=UPI001C03D676|nr:E3 ubiquitin-protein ligase MARCHF9-like [Melanotaenia boesemani]XP_041837649.1 E3 ubiquitin-protein ligase MARCHF9-like [Melanotaenia boesemani]
MFKYRIRMFFNELKVLLLMRSESSRRTDTGTGTDTQTRMRGLNIGGCGWPQISCSHQDDEEEYYGSDLRPRSLAFEDKEGPKSQGGGLDAASLPSLSESEMRTPQCRICFQGPEKGELLSPCRCDGSVRCTHQSCLIRWISERGSWSCELCYFKYQVLAISTKNPLQWQAISLTVIEKVQIAAIILGSLFLIASVSWLVWSSLSPSAKWQRQDLLFQICYGMYGFMDIVCIGLIIHEGSSVYRIFKRWQAVNQKWKVLNYEKAKDLGDPISSSSKAAGRVERNSSIAVTDGDHRMSRHVRTILNHHCGYTILHILSQLRPTNLNNTNQEVVMRVTTV